MVWILVIVGALIGTGIAEAPGGIMGAIFGYLLYTLNKQKSQLNQLQKKLTQLDLKQQSFEQQLTTKQQASLSKENDQAQTEDAAVQTQAHNTIIIQPEPITTELSYSLSTESESESKATPDPASEAAPEIKAEKTVSSDSWNSPSKTYTPRRSDTSEEVPTIPPILEKGVELVKNYFTQGNLIVRIGIIVLFFGMSFLAKYSIDNALLPIELRMAGIVLGAMVMLVIGWRLRLKKPAYALIMQGGGVAITYLAIFASFKLYHLISGGFAFPLLIVFSLLAMFLAVVQDSRALAITAITGGFASPILASTGGGNHIGLFSFYMVLNLAIFGVSWFKSWRMLNVIGFAFTFLIGVLWGVTKYKSEHFATTEPFLIGFFLIYVAISILFAIKQKPELKGYVDGTLVFGVPMVGFGLQTALVYKMEYGLAWSAFTLGFFYLSLTKILWKNSNQNFRLLCEAMLALGVIFATLTIPFALDGRWTAASWAIEGAGFIWIGIRQQRDLVKYFGILVQLIGGVLFLADYPYAHDALPFINTEFLGIIIVSIAGLVSAYLFNQDKISKLDTGKQNLPFDYLFLGWALCWWYIGGLLQTEKHISGEFELTAYVSFLAISAAIWLGMNLRLHWKLFSFFPWLLVAPLWLCFFSTISQGHFLEHGGMFSWPGALLLIYGIYYLCDKKDYSLFQADLLHIASYILITVVVAFESSWLLDDIGLANCWSAIAVAASLIAALQLINRLPGWPFSAQPHAYQVYSSLVLISGLLIWSFAGNFFAFLKPDPLPYIPIINPVDITQAIMLFVVIEWYRHFGNKLNVEIDQRLIFAIPAAFCFIWFNAILFKTLNVIDGVRYNPDALFDSALVQTSVSISWTLIGLAVMIFASKNIQRQLWIAGAVLTGIVVAKLFLLDLAEQDTIERIVSFLVVGILLLVVGYFSPVPPNNDGNPEPTENPELKNSSEPGNSLEPESSPELQQGLKSE